MIIVIATLILSISFFILIDLNCGLETDLITPKIEVPHDIQVSWQAKPELRAPFGVNACIYPNCSVRYARKTILEQHITIEHGSDLANFTCPVDSCDLAFNYPCDLIEHHYRQHLAVKICLFCRLSFRNHEATAKHMNRRHRTGCLQCAIEFDSLHNLSMHVCEYHTNQSSMYVCACGEEVKSCDRLLSHWREHFDMPKHQCMFCRVSVYTVESLISHLEKHGPKSDDGLQCQYCTTYKCTSARTFANHIMNDCQLFQHQMFSNPSNKPLGKDLQEWIKIGEWCMPNWNFVYTTSEIFMYHVYAEHGIKEGVTKGIIAQVHVQHLRDHDYVKTDHTDYLTCFEKERLMESGVTKLAHPACDKCGFPGCAFKVSELKSLKAHVTNCHRPQDLKFKGPKKAFCMCDICGRVFTNTGALRKHQGYINLRQSECSARCKCMWNRCETCLEFFERPKALVVHWRKTYCEPTEKQKETYKDIMKLPRIELKTTKCSLCGYKATTTWKLKLHLFYHHFLRGEPTPPEYPFAIIKCPKCDYRCLEVYKINRHYRSHANIKKLRSNMTPPQQGEPTTS